MAKNSKSYKKTTNNVVEIDILCLTEESMHITTYFFAEKQEGTTIGDNTYGILTRLRQRNYLHDATDICFKPLNFSFLFKY